MRAVVLSRAGSIAERGLLIWVERTLVDSPRSKVDRATPVGTAPARPGKRVLNDSDSRWAGLGTGCHHSCASSLPAHELIDYDDPIYINHNVHVLDGITWNGVRWAFTSGTPRTGIR